MKLIFEKFSDWMNGHRKYIRVEYDKETQDRLRQFCKVHDLDLTTSYARTNQFEEDFDFHSTIFYSNNKKVKPTPKTETYSGFVKPVKYNIFGPNKDVLVLEVESEDLNFLYNQYMELYDLKSDYPEYKPHISLTYNFENRVPEVMPNFPLRFDVLKVSNIIE